MPMRFTRRAAMALIGAAATIPPTVGAATAAAIDELALFGPPAGPSVTLAHAVATGRFDAIAGRSRFTAWRTPDELRAGLSSGSILLSVVPVQAAANLYNRGFPIRLANVMTNGLLYVISGDAGIRSVAGLAGKRVAVPFRGDTPEILFAQLLEHAGLEPGTDLELTYTGTPIEAMQMLLAGRVDAALTAEPAATAAILKGRQAGKQIARVIDIQSAWGAISGAAPVVPQAGLALTEAFIAAPGEAIPDLLAAISAATQDTLAAPDVAGRNATAALGMPAPLLAASVPHCNLVARPAREARGDVERMLTVMAGPEMAKIGGKLPDDAFYL